LDRYHRLVAEADKEPMVTGSTGQPRPNPLYDLVLKIEASVRADEKQLGIGLSNRLRIGLAETGGNALEAVNNAPQRAENPRAAVLKLLDGLNGSS
jgi:hypothetical protein